MFIGSSKRSNRTPRDASAIDGAAKRSSARLKPLLDVLIVDDDRELTELLALALGDHGAIVRTANSIVEARLATADYPPGVLVTDYHLPDGTGWELAHDLRTSGATAAMGLVAMSGTDVSAEHRAWFDGFLEKPVDAEQLYDVVRQLQHVVRERTSTPPDESFGD